jgi:hypothetical protein
LSCRGEDLEKDLCPQGYPSIIHSACGVLALIKNKNKSTKHMTYASSLALSRKTTLGYASRGQNTTSIRGGKERSLGPISNTVILIVLACLTGMLYLTQVTKTNAYGYQIEDLKTQSSQLQTEHDNLQVAAARLQSLDTVASSEVSKSLAVTMPSGTVR